jgi:predicted dehydrogenase
MKWQDEQENEEVTGVDKLMRVGLWGCGSMGRSLARALLATGEAELVAACDLEPRAADQVAQESGAEIVPSAPALLGYAGLDGVMIALPPDLHATAVAQAAAAGLDIFVEKPMSTTVTGCREMLSAIQQHGVQLMVGQVLRYYEPYRSIQRWQAEGRFGELYAAAIWRVTDGRRVAGSHWRASHTRSGGYLLEVGVHELDMLRCLMGRPQSVCAVARKVTPQEREWDDYVALQIRFAGGGAATYEGGAGSYVGRYGFRLYFGEATLLSDAAFDRSALQIYGPGGEALDVPDLEPSPEHPVEAELRDWLAALRGETPVPIPGEEGMASVALAEAAYRSAASGEVVAYEV